MPVAALPDAPEDDTALPGGPGFVMVPAAGFRPAGSSIYDNYNIAQGHLSVGEDPGGHFVADVALPHGATVTKVTLFAKNTMEAEAASLLLLRHPLPAHDTQPQAMAAVESGHPFCPACDWSTTTSIQDATVDLQASAYFLVSGCLTR